MFLWYLCGCVPVEGLFLLPQRADYGSSPSTPPLSFATRLSRSSNASQSENDDEFRYELDMTSASDAEMLEARQIWLENTDIADGNFHPASVPLKILDVLIINPLTSLVHDPVRAFLAECCTVDLSVVHDTKPSEKAKNGKMLRTIEANTSTLSSRITSAMNVVAKISFSAHSAKTETKKVSAKYCTLVDFHNALEQYCVMRDYRGGFREDSLRQRVIDLVGILTTTRQRQEIRGAIWMESGSDEAKAKLQKLRNRYKNKCPAPEIVVSDFIRTHMERTELQCDVIEFGVFMKRFKLFCDETGVPSVDLGPLGDNEISDADTHVLFETNGLSYLNGREVLLQGISFKKDLSESDDFRGLHCCGVDVLQWGMELCRFLVHFLALFFWPLFVMNWALQYQFVYASTTALNPNALQLIDLWHWPPFK